jgi:hypothetical protein
MQFEHKEKDTKRAYEKPTLRTIELVAEEVLGIGCKASPISPSQVGGFCAADSCSSVYGS